VTAGTGTPTICLVDDDARVLKAQARLLREHGFSTALFQSAEAFLEQYDASLPGCIVLDINMPGLDGLELQRRLGELGATTPVVFVTGTGDIPMSVRAIKAGAIDFLTKPVAGATLLAAVRAGVAQDARNRQALAEGEALRQRFASLSAREREVLSRLVAGKLNKQIAGELGITEATVKFHRARLMKRMRASTVAELMHLAARLQLPPG
jgi:FixJ family two-component response regulator